MEAPSLDWLKSRLSAFITLSSAFQRPSVVALLISPCSVFSNHKDEINILQQLNNAHYPCVVLIAYYLVVSRICFQSLTFESVIGE